MIIEGLAKVHIVFEYYQEHKHKIRAGFWGYCKSAIHNVISDYMTAIREEREHLSLEVDTEVEAVTPDTAPEKRQRLQTIKETIKDVDNALAQLPPAQRLIVESWTNDPPRVIAQREGLSIKDVQRLKRSAFGRLRRLLDKYDTGKKQGRKKNR
jgi:RNA polymerase sigma factor (sigma-70 family)